MSVGVSSVMLRYSDTGRFFQIAFLFKQYRLGKAMTAKVEIEVVVEIVVGWLRGWFDPI